MFWRANRDWVKLSEISPHVLAALIATEDCRSYEHHAIDLRRSVGAALNTFSGDLQGGSTLTQQLARNLYPEQIGRSASLTRQIKEAITAPKIEMVYTKDEILETYLNTVPFLYNAYGIEMAARTYFDKTADTLDVLESATLIGVLKGTSYYNPVLNPERPLQLRNTVLAPNLSQQLRRWLIDWADRNDYNIHVDGLVVRSTIDVRFQVMSTQAVAPQAEWLQGLTDAAWIARTGWGGNKALIQAFLREAPQYKLARDAGLDDVQALRQLVADGALMQALRREKTRLQAGLLALDPRNCLVLAWVGSRNFRDVRFDHVQQARRQPGLTVKPFVYGAAFEHGVSPNTTLMNEAVEIRLGAGGEVWRPSDRGESSGRAMTLSEGLIYSKNTITAQVMQMVEPKRVVNVAQALGVRQSKLDLVPSLALGTSPVMLREMVMAYSTIARTTAPTSSRSWSRGSKTATAT